MVRHDKRKITGIIDCLYGLLSSLHPPDLGRIKSIAVVLIEDAITIKKDCRTHQAHWPTLEGILPIFRQSRLHFNTSGEVGEESCLRRVARPA
ncbi:hypothetical protein XH99_09840 [Bradyrhizobium nanningense]|uniref:Uncharacterized protein n=1 Tax=Bradyrhizobium nanningense TaxID=1325118 RepID=A0A4V1L2P1_9BRAD|nr:hypothetical protein XH99_09840 [Bradyrhizobium nanningense]RXH34496.1 hypothetical protein XH84_06780 [Bradyrhizobium nanningense]